MERSLSLESGHMPVDGICCTNIAELASSGRADHIKGMSSASPTSDDHNFLIRSPFCAFLDSMEISLSLECNHVPVDGIWGCHSF